MVSRDCYSDINYCYLKRPLWFDNERSMTEKRLEGSFK